MEPVNNPVPISALNEILKWSVNRPEWQRDALRRIIVSGVIGQADLEQLNHLCRAKQFPDKSDQPDKQAHPLDESHIPPEPGLEHSVTLLSIGKLHGVNRIPSSQTISFGPTPGLTVIYGENASGKSGYARVLKKVCRTRGAPPVLLPNAFDPVPTGPATGTIYCRSAGKDYPVSWTDGIPFDSKLASVFVFDGSTAMHYISQDGPTSFTPSGLDVLPQLSKLCDAIGQFIQSDIERMTADIDATARNWIYAEGTSVGSLIRNMSAETKPEDIDQLSGLDATQTYRLKELDEALKSDPKQKAAESRAAAARLRAFLVKMSDGAVKLAEDKVSGLKTLAANAKTSGEAAKEFAGKRFDTDTLAGTGGGLWRKLWDAAREFSVGAAYIDQGFPVSTHSARCVLCQQELESDAVQRFKEFNDFCSDESQRLAEDAANQLKGAATTYERLEPLSAEQEKVEADLGSVSQTNRDAIAEFVRDADARLETIKGNLKTSTWSQPDVIGTSPVAVIESLVDLLESRAKTEESAENPETRQQLEVERAELKAREWLSCTKSEVLAQIECFKQVATLEICKKDTVTTGITSKNTELTGLLVTDMFCKRFKDEAEGLGLSTLDVKLEKIEGEKAETRFGLRFESQSALALRDVASEGEQRCIALAAFLAELSQASHQSALVFDDPVSSLDHWHREKIAARLVKESSTRQVVVFTHDAVFLNDLESIAAKTAVDATFRYLEWNGSEPGWCYDGLPWDCKSPEDRIDKLQKKQQELAKSWGPKPTDTNVSQMRDAYSWLRRTIERIVERVVFGDVVFRFRSYVNLKNLDKVVGFSQTECDELSRLFKRCSEVGPHDSAQGKQGAIPEPKDLKKDIDDTLQLLAQVRARQKAKASPPGPQSAGKSSPSPTPHTTTQP